MICSMNEMAKAQVLKLPTNKNRNQKFSRRTKHLVKCSIVHEVKESYQSTICQGEVLVTGILIREQEDPQQQLLQQMKK